MTASKPFLCECGLILDTCTCHNFFNLPEGKWHHIPYLGKTHVFKATNDGDWDLIDILDQ